MGTGHKSAGIKHNQKKGVKAVHDSICSIFFCYHFFTSSCSVFRMIYRPLACDSALACSRHMIHEKRHGFDQSLAFKWYTRRDMVGSHSQEICICGPTNLYVEGENADVILLSFSGLWSAIFSKRKDSRFCCSLLNIGLVQAPPSSNCN